MDKTNAPASPADALFAGVAPHTRSVRAGAALFRQGDPAIGVFRLTRGRIRLLRTTASGAQVTMHTARPGELFAEASLFSPRYHCDAIAWCDSELLLYPKRELAARLKEDPDALWCFAAELAHRVQDMRARVELRQIRSAPERVIQALRLRCIADGSWRLDDTLKQFAQELGLTHEALYRALNTLERSGRLRREGRSLVLLETTE